jgi:uncharacterized protein
LVNIYVLTYSHEPVPYFFEIMVNSWIVVLYSTAQDKETMTLTRTEQMVTRLRQMQAVTPDIEASAVVSVDGLIIASALPNEVEEDRVSAMSAAMLSLGERISTELGRGSLEQVYIKGVNGYVILTSIGSDAVLTALAGPQAKLGLIFLEMRRAAEDLERVVA